MRKEKSKVASSRKLTDSSLFISVIALVISIVISAMIMLLCGYDPVEAYGAIVVGAFGSLRGFAQTLTQATPLIFTGLAFTLAKKANLINLGVEGQMYMGALGAAVIGIVELGIPGWLHILLAVGMGFLFGAAYGMIVGILKVKFDSNEVVAGVMLNSIATCFINWLLNGVLLAQGSPVAQTERVVKAARLPRLFASYQVTIAIFLALVACVAIKWFISCTTLGYEIRAVGLNKRGAETAGISVGRSWIVAMLLSGGIAGLAGVNQVLGVDRRLISEFSPGYGFNGIAVAALAADDPVGVTLAGLIFGVLKAGALELNRTTGIPVEFVDVIQAMVVLFVSAPLLIRHMGRCGQLLRTGSRKEAK